MYFFKITTVVNYNTRQKYFLFFLTEINILNASIRVYS